VKEVIVPSGMRGKRGAFSALSFLWYCLYALLRQGDFSEKAHANQFSKNRFQKTIAFGGGGAQHRPKSPSLWEEGLGA